MSKRFGLGWQRSPVDHRDRLYLPPMSVRRLPRRVDLSDLLPPVLNQGETNTCGPHAVATIIRTDERDQGLPAEDPSRLFMYWAARYEMGDTLANDGVQNRALLKALNREGWCRESDWGFDPVKVQTQPPATCFTDALSRRIYDYAAVTQTLWHVCATLASRRPFLLGFVCFDSMFEATVTRTGDIPLPAQGEPVAGGHDVCCYGYDIDAGKLLIRNSWGEEWGQKGNGTIPLAYALDPRLAGDWWVIRSLPPVREPQVAALPSWRNVLAS